MLGCETCTVGVLAVVGEAYHAPESAGKVWGHILTPPSPQPPDGPVRSLSKVPGRHPS